MKNNLQKLRYSVILSVLLFTFGNVFSQKNESSGTFEKNKITNAKEVKNFVTPVKFGFEFPFNNVKRKHIFVSKNGWMTFDEGKINLSEVLHSGNIKTLIAPFATFGNVK